VLPQPKVDFLYFGFMVRVGFRTGNPWVGFSHTVPVPLYTVPVVGTTRTQPVNCAVSDETRGIHDTCGYFSLKYCKYSITCT
jgi:hypothetical protein